MKRLILIVILFVLMFSSGQAYAQQDPNDPGVADTVWFCPESLYAPVLAGDTTAFIHIMLVNDDTVGAVTVPLVWGGNVILDSVSFVNTRVESLEFNTVNIDPVQKKVLVANIPVEEEPILPGRGKIGTLVFTFETVDPVTLDTSFFPPVNPLRCVTMEPVAYTPQFVTSGSYPLVVYVPGDANKDGEANIVDVVHIANYVLKSGPPPNPIISGDVNPEDCVVDIVDVVYLANYILKSGPAPVPGCAGLDDC